MKTIVTSIITTIATVVVLFLASTMMHSYCSKNAAFEKGNEKCTMYKKHHGEKSCHKKDHFCDKESSDCPYAKENDCKFYDDFDGSHCDKMEKHCSKMEKHCSKMKSGDEKHCKKSSDAKKKFSCKHHKMNNGKEEIIEKEVTVEVNEEK